MTRLLTVLLLAFGLPSALADDAAAPMVVVSMEGVTHELKTLNLERSTMTLLENEIRYYLVQDDSPVSLNFNLSGTNILETGSAVYELPAANHGSEKIDLNFFNKDRESSRMQKRILFEEGTITIEGLNPQRLRMSFKGAGTPLLGKESFPIEGSVDVLFPSR